MIEMLGVLAIVGVLSIDGIAGYSKATDMFKANKMKQQIDQIFYQFSYQKDDWLRIRNSGEKTIHPAEIWETMGDIPDGMYNMNGVLKDIYGNSFLPSCTQHDTSGIECDISATAYSNDKNICMNILKVSQHYQKEIWFIDLRDTNTNNEIIRNILYPEQ